MSTRGLWGFTHNGVTKVTYNHYDSYLSGLGTDLVKALNFVLGMDPREDLERRVDALQLVKGDSTPTAEQIEQLKNFANLNVGNQRLDDWYSLLRETQGRLRTTLDSGFMIDGFEFGHDSLFCEWGYVIDLDVSEFVVYRGFTQGPVALGLWAGGDEPSIMPKGSVPITETGIDMEAWEKFQQGVMEADDDE